MTESTTSPPVTMEQLEASILRLQSTVDQLNSTVVKWMDHERVSTDLTSRVVESILSNKWLNIESIPDDIERDIYTTILSTIQDYLL